MGKALPAGCGRAHTCPSQQMSPECSHLLTDRIPRLHTSTSLSARDTLHSPGQFSSSQHPSGHPTSLTLPRAAPWALGSLGATPRQGLLPARPRCAPGPGSEGSAQGRAAPWVWSGEVWQRPRRQEEEEKGRERGRAKGGGGESWGRRKRWAKRCEPGGRARSAARSAPLRQGPSLPPQPALPCQPLVSQTRGDPRPERTRWHVMSWVCFSLGMLPLSSAFSCSPRRVSLRDQRVSRNGC